MKRLVFILMMVPVLVWAQKPVKPNVNKAYNSLKAGKLAEAKEMIDLATTYEKTMGDGKTWYYRGLIYATIDTTSKVEDHALAPDAFKTALESFTKADELNKSKNEYFISDANGLPITKAQQIGYWANGYLSKGATLYQDDNLDGALLNFDKTMQILPKDTTAFLYGGFVANSLEKSDPTIQYLTKYIENGGKSADAYTIIINVYNGQKNDKNKALEIVRQAKAKYPANQDFPKVEIGLLIDMGKIDEAKTGLENALKTEPNNKVLHFYLGYVNYSLKNIDGARKSYNEALRIDPSYFEAQFYLAKSYYEDAFNIKKQMNLLGRSEAENKKRFELDKQYMEKIKAVLPYWVKAEQLKPTDQEVLDTLYMIYTDLDDKANIQRIEKRYKELGIEN